MIITRTVKVPIHYQTTKKKLGILDRLTTRLTYGVNLFLEIIATHQTYTRKEIRVYSPEVREKTGLNAGHIQQCADKALWMWRSYWALHKKWEAKVNKAKGKRKENLLKREPQKSFPQGKVPVRLDCRTGVVKTADIELAEYVLELSTLKKRKRITIPLNPCKYHRKILKSAEIRDFEIISKKGKFYAHIVTHQFIQDHPVKTVTGIDLGVKRSVTAVSLPLAQKNFRILKDEVKNKKLHELNDRISHLRRLGKWEALKKLRNRRLNFAKDRDRQTAKKVVELLPENSCVLIGHPYLIRYNHYRGNGDKIGRKILQGWAFRRMASYIQEACTKKGTQSKTVNEWQTSSRCHRCGGKVIRDDRRITCEQCSLQYDADFNACIRLMLKEGKALLKLSPQMRRGLQMSQPELQMIGPRPMSAETPNRVRTFRTSIRE